MRLPRILGAAVVGLAAAAAGCGHSGQRSGTGPLPGHELLMTSPVESTASEQSQEGLRHTYVLEFKRENRVVGDDIQNALSPFEVHFLGSDSFELVPKNGVDLAQALGLLQKNLRPLGLEKIDIRPQGQVNPATENPKQNQFIPRHGFSVDFKDGLTEEQIIESLKPLKVTMLQIDLDDDENMGIVVVESNEPVNDLLLQLHKNPTVEKVTHEIGFYKDYVILQGEIYDRSQFDEPLPGDPIEGKKDGPVRAKKDDQVKAARILIEAQEEPGKLKFMFFVALEDNLTEDAIREKFHPLNVLEAAKLSGDKNAYLITIDSKSSSFDVEEQLKKVHGVKEVKFNNYVENYEPKK